MKNNGKNYCYLILISCLFVFCPQILLKNILLAEELSPNLLNLKKAKLVYVSDLALDPKLIPAAYDGDTTTALILHVSPDRTIELVYEFGGDVVSLDKLQVQIQVPETKDLPLGNVDILASDISPRVGYHSLREDFIKSFQNGQEFPFVLEGARWIMLRFRGAGMETRLPVLEMSVAGYPGPPKTNYPFKYSPASAIKVLDTFKRKNIRFNLAADETSLFADAQSGKFNKYAFGEAALIASGIQKHEDRQLYLQKYRAIVAAAKNDLRQVKGKMNKGKALLEWLHDKTLKGGYQKGQTSIANLLDTQTFNCVSSAVLYNLLALELGLDARGIEVPDHAYSIVYDGIEHVDVETTVRDGFNPRPDAIARLKNEKRLTYYEAKCKDQRREIKEPGLTAIIYSNRGGELQDQNKYYDALVTYFCALNLDREFTGAINNVFSALGNWSGDLAKAQSYPRALEVVQTGLELAPQDATLLYNHKVIWLGWAESAIDAGKPDQALAIYRQAAKAIPNGHFDTVEAWVFIKPSMAWVNQGKWKKALSLLEHGKKKVIPPAKIEIHGWARNVYSDWATTEFRQGHYEKAVAILENGMRFAPEYRNFVYTLSIILSRWAQEQWRQKGLPPAEKILRKYVGRYSKYIELKEAAESFIYFLINNLPLGPRYEKDILQAVNKLKDLLPSPQEFMNLVEALYDRMAGEMIRKNMWPDAMDLYSEALAHYTGNLHFRGKVDEVWDGWINSKCRVGLWDEAISLCLQAVRQAKNADLFKEKLSYIIFQKAEAICKQEGFQKAEAYLASSLRHNAKYAFADKVIESYTVRRLDEIRGDPQYAKKAETILKRTRALLARISSYQKLQQYVYDERAKAFYEQGQWREALDVYDEALHFYPKDPHVVNNAAATWDQWIQSLIDKKNWEEALNVCQEASGEPLDPDHFKERLGYIVQESAGKMDLSKDLSKAEKYFKRLLRRFPENKTVRQAVENRYGNYLQDLPVQKENNYEDLGLRLAASCKAILYNEEASMRCIHVAYDKLADGRESKQDWEGALQFYARALREWPQDEHLRHNAIATWDHWAQSCMKNEKWSKAVEIYKRAVKQFPKDGGLENNMNYCLEKSRK